MALKLYHSRYTKDKSTFRAIKLFYGGSKRFPVPFQEYILVGSLQPLHIGWCQNHGIKKLLNHWWARCCQLCDIITKQVKNGLGTLNFYHRIVISMAYKMELFATFKKKYLKWVQRYLEFLCRVHIYHITVMSLCS